ncbi:MAG: stalk domain-containing protein [Defluviitaleaceae bacterium]|nr:stalk domain-containing protein [Defluviitaleaceae bacterium]
MKRYKFLAWMLITSFALSMLLGFTTIYANTPNDVTITATPRTAVSFPVSTSTYVVAIRDDGNLWAVEHPFAFTGEETVGRPFIIKENVMSVSVSWGSRSNDYLGHLYAITEDGTLWRWGNDIRYHLTRGISPSTGEITYHQSYSGNGITIHEPPAVFKENVAFVVSSLIHTLAITTNGRLWSWGLNDSGQLGDGTTNNRCEPVEIMDNVIQAGISISRSWAVTSDGDFYVWGSDNGSHPGLGGGSAMYLATPTQVMSGVRYAAQTYDHIATTFIIMDDGSLWGHGGGIVALTGGRRVWIFVPIMENVVTIWAGYFIAVATLEDGTVWIWGDHFGRSFIHGVDDYDNDFPKIPVNTPVPAPLGLVSFTGNCTQYALTATGDIIAWTNRRAFPHPESDNFPNPIVVMTSQPTVPRILRFAIGSTSFTDSGTSYKLEAAPFIAYNRTMVPLRVIIEALGATDFNFTSSIVSFILNGETISMTINQPLPGGMGAPVIIEGRTFVPLAYIINVIGATARWDGVARVAYIYID